MKKNKSEDVMSQNFENKKCPQSQGGIVLRRIKKLGQTAEEQLESRNYMRAIEIYEKCIVSLLELSYLGQPSPLVLLNVLMDPESRHHNLHQALWAGDKRVSGVF